MDDAIRQKIQSRAEDCCEYCLLPQQATPFLTFHIEHIIAQQHLDSGYDDLSNLALSCDRCNAYKGPNLSSIDPQSKQHVILFHPRTDVWDQHFRMTEGKVIGLTATGRATVRLLNMNAPRRVELRVLWLES